MEKPPIGSQALRRGRVSEPGRAYFITKATRLRLSAALPPAQRMAAGPLVQPGVPEILLGSLRWLEDLALIRLIAYCLMPDHIHLLFQLGTGASLAGVMRRFASFTGLQVARVGGPAPLWADGFQDHALRAEESLADIVAYIEENPVAAGPVASAADWPWASRARSGGAAAPERGGEAASPD